MIENRGNSRQPDYCDERGSIDMNEQVEQDVEQTAEQVQPGDPPALPAEPAQLDEHGKGAVLDELAKLPEKAILDEAALAKALHVAPRTLRRMVNRWQLPPPVPLGGRSVWFAGRVLAHIEAAAIRAEKDAERAARKFRENFT